MSDTDESYVEPLTSHLPTPSTESVKNESQVPTASVETIKASENPQSSSSPQPSVDYEKKSL